MQDRRRVIGCMPSAHSLEARTKLIDGYPAAHINPGLLFPRGHRFVSPPRRPSVSLLSNAPIGFQMESSLGEDGLRIPFSEEDGLLAGRHTSLPGRPLIPLASKSAVAEFLGQELSNRRLDAMYRMLFLVSNRRNISPLHHQILKGRDILVTERVDLHLVWYYGRIFVKPVPRCLLSYSFWMEHLLPSKGPVQTEGSGSLELYLEARGFLRTYASLIVHESDFTLAKNKGLFPSDVDVTWEAWCRFIAGFRSIRDAYVTRRYHYGELRLTRLNFWFRILHCGQCYFEVHYNYITFFSGFVGPYVFMFSIFTVMLTGLQTALQAGLGESYQSFTSKFVPASLVIALIAFASFPLLFVGFQLHELLWFFVSHRKQE